MNVYDRDFLLTLMQGLVKERGYDMTIVYRTAVAEDAKRLAELRWEFKSVDEPQRPALASSPDFEDVCRRFFEDGVAAGTWKHWVAEEAGEIISVVSAQVVEKVPKPACLANRFGYVTNVYTKPAWRRRGIGAKLMACVKEWASDAAIEFLIVWPSETSAVFYARSGFVCEREAMVWQVQQ